MAVLRLWRLVQIECMNGFSIYTLTMTAHENSS